MQFANLPTLCAALVLAAATTAQAQETVSIEVDVVQTVWSNASGPSYVGDFVASGAISDTGPAAWYTTYSSLLYLEGEQGDISIVFDAEGWSVAAGTGAYENLRGGGAVSSEWYLTPNPWVAGTFLWGVRFSMIGTVELVENAPPVARLAVTSVSGLTVDLSAGASSDPDGSIVAYEWDLNGDGVYDRATTQSDVQHTYGAAGTYDVTVRVTDDRGATDTASVSVTVQAAEPPPGGGKGGGKGKGKKK